MQGAAYPVGRLSHRLGRRALLAAGFVVLAVADVVLAIAPGVWVVLLGAALWGLPMGMTQGLLATVVAEPAPPSLRQRRNHWAGQAVLGCLLSGLTAVLAPPSWPQAAMAAPTFFLMGCACLLPTVALWRAAAAVHACHTPGRVVGHLVWRLAHRFRTR